MLDTMIPVISCVITAIVTLIVCLINNHYQDKRHMAEMQEDREKNQQKIAELHANQMTDLKQDLMSHMEELMANITSLDNSMDMVNYKIEELSKRVEKHNQVVERTYIVERDLKVHDEMIKVANHRLADLEKKGEK